MSKIVKLIEVLSCLSLGLYVSRKYDSVYYDIFSGRAILSIFLLIPWTPQMEMRFKCLHTTKKQLSNLNSFWVLILRIYSFKKGILKKAKDSGWRQTCLEARKETGREVVGDQTDFTDLCLIVQLSSGLIYIHLCKRPCFVIFKCLIFLLSQNIVIHF